MIHHKRKIGALMRKTHMRFDAVHQSTRHALSRTWQLLIGALWFVLSFILFPSFAFGVTYPTQQGYVNDFAQMLSPTVRTELEQKLTEYEQQTTNEIAVVTIASLEGDPIEDYSIRLFEKWKIGKAGKDNGVLLLVSKEEKLIRIDVGYGLEPVLTDGESGTIIRSQMVPKFKTGDYEGGIRDGVFAIISGIGSSESGVDQVVGNNPLRTSAGSKIDSLFKQFGEFIFFIPMALIYLTGYMARTKSIVLGGIVGGVGGAVMGLLLGTTTILAALVIGGIVLGLLFDWILSRNYKALSGSGGRTDWFHTYGGFGGSQGFGGFGSSRGFGGFGGGRSGGGGSSGGW